MSWRRLGTIAALLAVVAVAAAAVVDAIRPDSGEASDALGTTTTGPEPDPVKAVLEAEEIGGVLYYSDPEDDCRMHAVRLPDLEQVPPPKVHACRFELPLEPGTGALDADSAWQPGGSSAASCTAGRVSVSTQAGDAIGEVEGCAPAWKPDRTLTVVRDGEVWGTPCPGPEAYARRACWRKLLSTAELTKAAHAVPLIPAGPRYLRSVAAIRVVWFSDTRAAVIVRVRLRGRLRTFGPVGVLAVYEGTRLVRATPYAGAINLRLSPRRAGVAVAEAGERVSLVDRNGRVQLAAANLPSPNALAVAWSPDERWTAVATRWSVYLLRTEDIEAGHQLRSIRLPFAARDLAWR